MRIQGHDGLPVSWRLLSILLALLAPGAAAETMLTLPEAEELALASDPQVRAYESQATAYSERSIAEGQWADPQLKVGIDNLPADSFSRTDDDMTQIVVGVQQALPRGKTLRFRSEQMSSLSRAEAARAANRRLLVLQSVRTAYLELYRLTRAAELVAENRALYDELRQITERQYAAGRDNHHDVIRAQLELSLLDDRVAQAGIDRDRARAELGRWVTPEQGARPLPTELPALPEPRPKTAIAAALPRHPLIDIEDAMVEAGEKSVAIAGEQYKPAFMVDMSYGQRGGDMDDGSGRPDMLSAMVTMDLPLFRAQRQDRNLAASRAEVSAAAYNRADRLKELTRSLDAEHAAFERMGERLRVFESQTMAESRQNVDATMTAYETGRTEFNDILRARATDLDTRLALLQIRVERARAAVNLRYLAGE